MFTRNQNELHAAKRLVSHLREDDVIVYDRAFLSYTMLVFHLKRGLHAVFRAKEKNTFKCVGIFLASNKTDEIVRIYCKGLGEVTVRLISYKIKKKALLPFNYLNRSRKIPAFKIKGNLP